MTTKSKHISEKELKSVFWRAFLLPCCYSMDRMQAPGFAYSMLPVLRKLYGDDHDKLSEACSRHSELYNNTFAMSPLVLGIATAMEEAAANDENFDVNSINSMKIALMGPLAGIGDTFFWVTFRIIGSGIGIALAQKGSVLGPLLFLLIYNIPHLLTRVYGLRYGYKLAANSIDSLVSGGLLSRATRSATIMGLVVVGGMIKSMVKANILYEVKIGEVSLKLQSILDDILPGLLSLLFTFGVYYLLKRGHKPYYIMFSILILSIALKYFGIM